MQKFNIMATPVKQPKLMQSGAESLAIEALSFLGADPMRLDRFFALTGINPGHLRAAAAEPGFLTAILSHLASDEKLLLAFAAHAGHDPAAVASALEILSPPPERA